MAEDEEEEIINSTKTVVVAEDIHNAISHIAADEDESIKRVVDNILRDNDSIQTELEIRAQHEN